MFPFFYLFLLFLWLFLIDSIKRVSQKTPPSKPKEKKYRRNTEKQIFISSSSFFLKNIWQEVFDEKIFNQITYWREREYLNFACTAYIRIQISQVKLLLECGDKSISFQISQWEGLLSTTGFWRHFLQMFKLQLQISLFRADETGNLTNIKHFQNTMTSKSFTIFI